MKSKNVLIMLFLFSLRITISAQTIPSINWSNTFGGSDFDEPSKVFKTPDGNYIMVSSTPSSDGTITGSHGGLDLWVVKMNSGDGTQMWQQLLGGTQNERLGSVLQLSDSDLIIASYSDSNDGDVTDNHGSNDLWLIRMDENGNIIWKKCFGGAGEEFEPNILYTKDGNLLIAGQTTSSDGDVSGYHASANGIEPDYWVLKIDLNGNILWQLCLGGSASETNAQPFRLKDGSYVIGGNSNSNDGDVTGVHIYGTYTDTWIAAVSDSGQLMWQKALGGSLDDQFVDMVQPSDGNITVLMNSNSSDGDITDHHGDYDNWLAKLSPSGNLLLTKSLGGSRGDYPMRLLKTRNGKMLLASSEYSSDGDVVGHHGPNYEYDVWLVRLKNTLDIRWQLCLGGTGSETGSFVSQNRNDGSYIVAASTNSTDGNVVGNHNQNFWLVKVNEDGQLLWSKSMGGSGAEFSKKVLFQADSGFLISGSTESHNGDITTGNHGFYDVWIASLNPEEAAPLSLNCSFNLTSVCSGDKTYYVEYTATGIFNKANTFVVELSDTAGGFANPVDIGSFKGIALDNNILVQFPAGTSGTNYRVRVRSTDPVLTSADNGVNISVSCPPVNGLFTSLIGSTSATINWSITSCAVKYQYRYRKVGDVLWTSGKTSGTSKKISGLIPNNQYEWSVQSWCSSDGSAASDWASSITFGTGARLSNQLIADESDLIVFPNPVSSLATIKFSLLQLSNVSIKLFSLDGKELMLIANDDVSEGTHELTFNRESLSAGIYFLEMKTNKGMVTEKLIVE